MQYMHGWRAQPHVVHESCDAEQSAIGQMLQGALVDQFAKPLVAESECSHTFRW